LCPDEDEEDRKKREKKRKRQRRRKRDLANATVQIGELEETLANERQERENLERRVESLELEKFSLQALREKLVTTVKECKTSEAHMEREKDDLGRRYTLLENLLKREQEKSEALQRDSRKLFQDKASSVADLVLKAARLEKENKELLKKTQWQESELAAALGEKKVLENCYAELEMKTAPMRMEQKKKCEIKKSLKAERAEKEELIRGLQAAQTSRMDIERTLKATQDLYKEFEVKYRSLERKYTALAEEKGELARRRLREREALQREINALERRQSMFEDTTTEVRVMGLFLPREMPSLRADVARTAGRVRELLSALITALQQRKDGSPKVKAQRKPPAPRTPPKSSHRTPTYQPLTNAPSKKSTTAARSPTTDSKLSTISRVVFRKGQIL